MFHRMLCCAVFASLISFAAVAVPPLEPVDVFALEYALDPQISPDGKQVAYVRRSMDIMTDRMLANIWTVASDGSRHRPFLSGTFNYTSPRWSPTGDRLAYLASAGERGAEIHVRWMDSGQSALLTNLAHEPRNLSWSPDGKHIAFTMLVTSEGLELAAPPRKPDGANWAEPVKVIDRMPYRFDGRGYLAPGHAHVFVIPSDGGTARQLTTGDYDHDGTLSWSPDSRSLVLSANRVDNPLDEPVESELWLVDVPTGALTRLTDRDGPDFAPVFASDGEHIAYLGFDDRKLSAQQAGVYLLHVESARTRPVLKDLDRAIDAVAWAGRRNALYVQFDEHGRRRLARLELSGAMTVLVDNVGSATQGRPYTSGGFSVARDGTIAYTLGDPLRPSEVGLLSRGGRVRQLTALNEDLLGQRELGSVEALTWRSGAGEWLIEGWIVKPPGFDPKKKYPLILEIHGGPFAAYGPHFSPEIQLYAAAGYVVLYSNPRGSSSYGQAFMNEIHHEYPGRDYDDLMTGVDAVIDRGFIDENNLFVTGGSGGGVLTAWIVGQTDRFRAAVVQKPVVNWASFALTADLPALFTRYWFASMPWDDAEEYWRRSPLALVGRVSTPTMLMTGEQDFRTPIAESEQYYTALKLRGVDTALVRVPERSHNLVDRPSHLIAKATNILGWFGRYRSSE